MPMWWGMSGFYNGLASHGDAEKGATPERNQKPAPLNTQGCGTQQRRKGIERAASGKRPVLKLLLRTDGKVHIKSIRCGAQP
jgi:hypothetical protein